MLVSKPPFFLNTVFFFFERSELSWLHGGFGWFARGKQNVVYLGYRLLIYLAK